MAEIENLQERLQEANERLREKTAAYDRATGSRDEIQRKVRRRKARRDRIRKEAEARDFIPGTDSEAAVAVAEDEAENLDERIAEAENRIERLKREKDTARQEQREAARALARALAGKVAEAEAARVEALARLGSVVLPAYSKYRQAAAERRDVERELKSAVGTAAATPHQKRQLKNYLQAEPGDPPVEALLGRLLADVLGWSRLIRRGPLPELLEGEGIELTDGSPHHRRPVPAQGETLAWIQRGRLPDSPSIT